MNAYETCLAHGYILISDADIVRLIELRAGSAYLCLTRAQDAPVTPATPVVQIRVRAATDMVPLMLVMSVDLTMVGYVQSTTITGQVFIPSGELTIESVLPQILAKLDSVHIDQGISKLSWANEIALAWDDGALEDGHALAYELESVLARYGCRPVGQWRVAK